jgi:hypothetical protein
MASRASRPRTRVGPRAACPFRGMIRCETCGRKMEGAAGKQAMFYRCAAWTVVLGSKGRSAGVGRHAGALDAATG